ncbi:MAG: cyclase family protein [Chloroflexi bacterium]|nr:cyclase family protein [Chloroflexota bacterium]
MPSRWIDVSVPIRNAMVHWPSDPAVSIKRVSDVAKGDSHTLSEVRFGSHTGTHMDAPAHFLAKGSGIDKIPLETSVGRARVIEIKDKDSIKPSELVSHRLRRGERILFKTHNSSFAWQTNKFVEDFVYLSKEAADFLVARGVVLVGIDYLSVGSFKRGDGTRVHQMLLSNNIILIEGLNLSQVNPGKYELVCLPLRLEAGDGAPARAILRPVK